MKSDLKQLYSRLILERQKNPIGFEKRENAQIVLEAYNPVCGDQFKLYLDLDDQTIKKASYYGYGCALSKAATSLLIEGLRGKTVQESKQFIESYLKNLEHNMEGQPEIYRALAIAKNFPGRKQCTTLTWDEVSKYINDKYPNF